MPKLKGTFEERVINKLEKAGVQFQYEPHNLPYTVERQYYPDLLVGDIYIELKGFFRQDAQRKMKAVKQQNPDMDIRFVFQSPFNKIYKGSKTTYAKWAEKHGFPWCAFHSIPIEWLT